MLDARRQEDDMGAERHVKFFRNDGAQAVVIPPEFEIPGEEAVMRKEGDRLVIEPVMKNGGNLIEWLQTLEPLDEDVPDMDEKGPLPRDVDL
jgi:antitoxin VapB